jgi:hypothetical protein
MSRSVTRWCLLGVAACLIHGSPASAQDLFRAHPRSLDLAGVLTTPPARSTGPVTAARTPGELHGIVRDDEGRPLNGAVVSAHGSTAAFAMSDREGRFAFRSLPPGPYLVRVHLDGYAVPRGRYVQVNAGRREVWDISLDRVGTPDAPRMLTAGVGAVGDTASPSPARDDETSELAWRLRHMKRSVLREAHLGVVDDRAPDSFDEFGRVVGSPARFASALFAELDGQVNLLTTTSFDSAQDLFSIEGDAPQPIAYLAVSAPTAGGNWSVRGSMTQGDISSWIVAGSFTRRGPATHEYEVGASYATQRYQGANVEALAAVSEQSRQVGELHASDTWTVTPQVTVGAGGRYASYGYLNDRSLLSGRMQVVVQPSRSDPLRLSLSASHREIAPGAEEFVPPPSGMWLPPDRTFSELTRRPFRPERLDHIEIAGEREVVGGFIVGLRGFRQQIDDQLLTVFGELAEDSTVTLGHYQVGTAGDFASHGWGVSVTRDVISGTAASVAYTFADVDSQGLDARSEDLLVRISPSLVREKERIHDVTASVRSRLAPTATRLYVVYKLNTAYAEAAAAVPLAAARFEVQINQEMPFLDFTGASWEMLVGVRNLFRSDLYDGSIYDELLVIRPPKRVMGGVTVRF